MNIREELKYRAESWRKLSPKAPFIFDEWLLKHGEEQGPSINRRGTGYRLKPIKQCYCNSMRALLWHEVDSDEWFYTEGVMYRKNLPILIDHAWLSNREGQVLDLTLRNQSPEDEYYGVPLTLDYAQKKTLAHGYYGLFSNGCMYNMDVMDTVEEGRAWPKKCREELNETVLEAV